MPVGPDTDRRGSARSSRNLHWEDTGTPGFPEFRHQGEDFEYIARHEPDFEGDETPWTAAIFDDSGRYSAVSGKAYDLADAQSLAVAYHQNEWQPGTERDLQNPDNPDYVAEGTEGMWEGDDDYTRGEGDFDSPTNAGSYQDPDPYPEEHLGPEYYHEWPEGDD